jgi:predicted ATPase with chaperone activity
MIKHDYLILYPQLDRICEILQVDTDLTVNVCCFVDFDEKTKDEAQTIEISNLFHFSQNDDADINLILIQPGFNAFAKIYNLKKIMSETAIILFRTAFEKIGIQCSRFDSIIKVSKCISTLDHAKQIEAVHVAEAIGYCSKTRL